MKRLILGLSCLLTLAACSSPFSTTSDGSVRIRWSRDPETLDPLIIPNPNALEAINLLHCSLLTVDYAQEKFVPWLAAAMPTVRHTDSLTQVTYRLRPEARWDNGKPVLANDVAFTLKLMNCPGLPYEAARAQYGFIEAIHLDPTSNRTFTISFRGSSPELVQSSGDYPILPEAELDPTGLLRKVTLQEMRADTARNVPRRNPAVAAFVRRYQSSRRSAHPGNVPGCGPYTVAQWQSGRYLLLRRKKHWWADDVRPRSSQYRANPPALDYEIIADDATALLALRRGDLDLFPMVPAKEFVRLKQSKAAQDLRFYTAPSYEMLAAGFNTRRPEFSDALTRQALSNLFDVTGLIKASQQGMAEPSASLISPHTRPFYNDSLPLPRLDLQKCRSLLIRAGWQQRAQGWVRRVAGKPQQLLAPTFSYRTGNPAFEAAVLQFRTAAAQLGIRVTPAPTEAALLTTQLRAGQVQLYLQLLSGNPFIYNFAPILHSQSNGWGNFTGFGTATSDALIEAIAAEADPVRQAQLLRRFQRLMQQECPLVVLYFLHYRVAAAGRLSNLHISGLRPGYEAAAIVSQSGKKGQP